MLGPGWLWGVLPPGVHPVDECCLAVVSRNHDASPRANPTNPQKKHSMIVAIASCRYELTQLSASPQTQLRPWLHFWLQLIRHLDFIAQLTCHEAAHGCDQCGWAVVAYEVMA